ncbi:hypothetical protein [Zavarzinia compransoris]|uniref:hypothetical protein n=1 Tax=Zavarzinia compransoris TaxID=1264899 RepID=UPI001B87FE6F
MVKPCLIENRSIASEGGRPVPDRRNEVEALIAATALIHGLRVVTRNIRDFEGTGVVLVDPWQG